MDIAKGNKGSIRKTVVTWNEKEKVFLCSIGHKTIKIAASLGEKTHDDMVTPEELFVDSVEGFIKDAFLDSAKRDSVKIVSYDSEGQGIVGKDGDKLIFTEIKIWPRIVVSTDGQIKKAQEIIKQAVNTCGVSNFIKSKISVYPEIVTG